ncbi:hypothetical protein SKAU_G00063430 [Synaphobranchus kaupii]|uniref:Reverse transcriptase domain-containing protein n=1 Tax=Synaphobranchus kaupii TaxID=118154 RepID=A0A9Q1G645_SYNKA|nr:hypothetical protein SKAU_G00063430 [Synaphobranchus kaupii]
MELCSAVTDILNSSFQEASVPKEWKEKAFNKVDHTIAANCLIDLRVRLELIPWVLDFMTDWKQRMIYQGCMSSWLHLTCGVVQGTKLRPILFLAVIDIALCSHAARWKYVDDMIMVEQRHSTQPSSLQPVMDELSSLVSNQAMQLNPKKCKAVHINFSLCCVGAMLNMSKAPT